MLIINLTKMLVWQLACVVLELSAISYPLTAANSNDLAVKMQTMDTTITTTEKFVIAKIFVRPESIAAFRQELDALAILTRKEPGCIAYTYYPEPEGKGAFTLIEHYRDGAGLRYHFQQSYLAEFVKKMEGWKSKELEVHFLSVERDALREDK